jgi:hypothetical protein
MIFQMKRHFFWGLAAVSAGAFLFSGCSTTESRISEHPELYGSLSTRDQELVARGQIRSGMPESAVWLAWGSPEQKTVGMIRGSNTETWIYLNYSYPYYGYGYGYPYGGFYGGFYGRGIIRAHHGHRYVIFGDPFFDPFYSYIPPRVEYPYKTVTFVNGRVVAFQHLVGPYRY